MRFFELDQPSVGDIVELEINDELVEAVIVEINDDTVMCETDNEQGQQLLEAQWGRSSWDSNMPSWQDREQRAMDADKSAFKRQELEYELRGEQEPFRHEMQSTWYLKINGKVYKQNGMPKSFTNKKAANAYALAILKNKPELQGKVMLTTKPIDESVKTEDKEQEDPVAAFMARGGKIEYGKTHKPRKGEKWQGSSHIGSAGGKGTKGQVSGLAANTRGGKPVVTAGEYSDGPAESPVASAIIRRIMLQRTDLLAKFGPERVGQAVDDVAYFVGDVEEIGSSDVSAWVKQVEQSLSHMHEAEYQGRPVKLGKPMQGDVKKFKVYVKNPKTGNVVKVNFGDPNMRIKKSNPKRRKSFRARHNCANPGPRTKARYWSCRKW